MSSTENKDLEKDILVDDTAETDEEVVIHKEGEHHHSHHSHHHHSHGHHRKGKHRHRSSKNSSKKPDNRKVVFYRIFVVAVIVVFVVVLLSALHYFEKKLTAEKDKNNEQPEVVLNGEFAVVPEIFDGDIDIIGEVAKKCYELDADKSVIQFVKSYRVEGVTYDKSAPVILNPKVYNMPEDYSFSGYRVAVSEKEDLFDATVFEFSKGEEIAINYLKTNTKYYYRVTFLPGDLGYSGSFKTSDTPRILSIDGIGNVRDIGNWETNTGKRIKQGLVYRGMELDGAVESEFLVTDAGKKVFTDILGIKFDMDLRGAYENPTGNKAFDKSIEHKYYDCVMYKGIFSDDGKAKIKEIFTDLADPANYPMYLHCTYGMDRTGTVCFLIEALLGVSDEDLQREYELTTLYYYSNALNNYNTMLTALEGYEGATTQEKVENYLLDCGVTPEQIQSIRNIFLEQ